MDSLATVVHVVSKSSPEVRVERGAPGDLNEVGALFREMVEHHRQVVRGAWPVRTAGEAWRRRRREYEQWLPAAGTWLLLARMPGDPGLAGYAMLRLHEVGASWDIGDHVAELESLSVAARVRGRGVGTALLDAARDICRDAGVSHWLVEVVDANADAIRFYERGGFRPFYRQMLAELPVNPVPPPAPAPPRRDPPATSP